MTKGESATVELKKGAVEDQKLNRDIWSTVERCAQRMPEHPAENTARSLPLILPVTVD